MSASRLTHLAKELTSYAPWSVPGSLLVGWMAWPALTPTFKQETLGLKPPQSSTAPAGSKSVFRSSGKYKYVKNEIGEPPTLVED
ncbi:hypothetical protein PsorP6_016684 [Peronosclerospora sorghi]|uniref:Uncharacterized protein n=1 Tax=Peronosclerospora sorghi TaxID=230839 RepID=A0ACC0VQF5_9STRA|nr:hypothetical protein PsorP6_016684 [Peronosclerospora sorghi]